jgi:D-serine deaminase-like pyridoxal phosphate-dependent protein
MTHPTDIETPAVLIDLDRVDRNIARFQEYCDRHDIAVRPHIKTHKLPRLARQQIEAGAVGITCQKIGEAEVMADAGIEDIFITYNIVGETKLRRLAQLARRCRLSTVTDNAAVVAGLAGAFQHEAQPLKVLVECDTGAGRCGVQTSAEALALARQIHDSAGLALGGLMTYPPMTDQAPVETWLNKARAALLENGLPCPTVSSGGTPNMWRAHEVPSVTEHRAGTYIYNDRSLVQAGVCTAEDCALHVLATVVSRPTPTRAIVDAGSKVLTSDLLGLQGYGMLPDFPGARLRNLSEEHGIIDLSNIDWSPKIGDPLRIIPNHACVVSNMVDTVYLIRGNEVETEEPVAARGRIT